MLTNTDAAVNLVPNALIAQAKSVDLRKLAETYTQLKKWATGELAGACPKPGCTAQTDGFHVRTDWFKCYQCHPQHGDAIEFMQWLEGLSFREAVEALTGAELPKGKQIVQAKEKSSAADISDDDYRVPQWQHEAQRIVQDAHRVLLQDATGEPGRAYLRSRAIEPDAWLAYHLGFQANVSIPGTQGQQKAAAISLPWIVNGGLRGIRYRFLAKQGQHKQSALYGSRFTGGLFGEQALCIGVPALSTLLFTEGEFNTVSCWQIAHSTALDVYSIGSETTTITDAMLELASQYRTVIVWTDQRAVANTLLNQIEGAWGIQSPNDHDANDLLQKGLLGAFLSSARLKAAENDYARQALLWDLWDGARIRPQGVDTGTAQVIQNIADSLGLLAPLQEREDGCWLAACTL